MSKWIDKFNASNKKQIEKRINKLIQEYHNYRREFADYPYNRYQRAMDNREAEIEELKMLVDPKNLQREIDDWKSEVDNLRALLGKAYILAINIDPCDRKSDENLRRLINMTGSYKCTDLDFKAHAESGIW